MKTYYVIYEETELVKVMAETEDDANLKVLYSYSKKELLDEFYGRVMGHWNKYFVKQDLNFFSIEECINDCKTAQTLFLTDAEKIPVLKKNKEIILEFLSGDKDEDWWIENDPFPVDLKKYIIQKYHNNIVYAEDEIAVVN